MPLWCSSGRSPETVCTGRHWKTCCGIAWSVHAETPAYSASSWPIRLTFEKAMTIAKSNETAERGAKDLSGGAVHQLHSNRRTRPQPPKPRQPTPQPPTQPCSRCGAFHSPSTCKFKTAICHYCKKIGYLASVCRKKARDQKSAARVGRESRNHLL